MADKKFIDGMFVKRPHQNAPDFIKLNISIKVEQFIKWLQENKTDSEYLNIDLKKSREGNLYLELNTFKADSKENNEEPF